MTAPRIHALGRWLAPAVPARRLALVRIAVLLFATGWMVLTAGPDLIERAHLPPARFDPVGLARWTGLVAPELVTTAVVVVSVVGLMATAGIKYRVTAPVFGLGLWWLLSYRNSWGHMSHVEHLLVLHVGILALAPADDALRPGRRGPEPPDDTRYGWPLRLCMLVTVSTYAIAGLAKLRIGGLDWLYGDVLRLHVAHEVLRTRMVGASNGAGLGGWVLPHAWAFTGMAVSTIVLEIGAGLALRTETWLGRMWLGGLWLMHLGIWAVMGIGFPYPLSGVAFAAFFELERGVDWARGLKRG